jgi:integrase
MATVSIKGPFIPKHKQLKMNQLYRAFSEHRPLEMKQPDSPFFLPINHHRRPSSQIWYSKAVLGKNEIGKFLSKAAKAAKLPGNITNHSVRKTCISCLIDANIPY